MRVGQPGSSPLPQAPTALSDQIRTLATKSSHKHCFLINGGVLGFGHRPGAPSMACRHGHDGDRFCVTVTMATHPNLSLPLTLSPLLSLSLVLPFFPSLPLTLSPLLSLSPSPSFSLPPSLPPLPSLSLSLFLPFFPSLPLPLSSSLPPPSLPTNRSSRNDSNNTQQPSCRWA